MGRDRSTSRKAGVVRPIDLILTTFAALLLTAAVASGGRINYIFHREVGTEIQTIKSLNMLIQRAYLSEAGSGITCIMHWNGPAELTGNGSHSTLTFPTNIDVSEGAFSLQDPGAIIRSVFSNGSHIIVEYNLRMNNLTIPAGEIVLVIKRNHDGIRLELRL